MSETIGDRVIDALNRGAISAADLANRAGVSYSVIINLKRRPGSSTHAWRAERIAQVLDNLDEVVPAQMEIKPILPAKEPARTGFSESTAFDHGNRTPKSSDDMRVQVIDGKLVVEARVGRHGIAALKKMIEAWEETLD